MFKRKRKLQTKAISMHSIIRSIIYDSGLPNPEDVAEILGLNRVSDEVAEREQYESEARVSRLWPIMPIVESHAAITAKLVAASYLSVFMNDANMSELEGVDPESLERLFNMVTLSATVSCLASFMELNLIKEMYDV